MADKYILVPIDFSEHSYRAAQVAVRVAERMAVPQITFLHACAKGQMNLADQLIEFNNRLLKDIESAGIATVRFSFQVAPGVPEEVIKVYASQNEPSLIVMATRSKAQKQQDMIGSVCAEFIERTEWPVLVVPAQVPVQRILTPSHVAYSTSFSQRDISELDDMMRVLNYRSNNGQTGLSLSFVHIRHTTDAAQLQQRIDSLKSYMQLGFPDVDFSIHILDKPEHQSGELRLIEDGMALFNTLQNFLVTYNIDLLTIKNSKSGLFSRLFVDSTAKKLINEGNIAMLVM